MAGHSGELDLTSMLKWKPCQGSELLLDKDIWTNSKGSTPMLSGQRITQLGLGLINLLLLHTRSRF